MAQGAAATCRSRTRNRAATGRPTSKRAARRDTQQPANGGRKNDQRQPHRPPRPPRPPATPPQPARDERKRGDAEAREEAARAAQARRSRIDALEARIAETEAAIRELEARWPPPVFTTIATAAQPVIDRHQALMWKVGDLMHQWEELQAARRPTRRRPTPNGIRSLDYSSVN